MVNKDVYIHIDIGTPGKLLRRHFTSGIKITMRLVHQFVLANMNSRLRSLYVLVRPSVVRQSFVCRR